MPVQGAVSPRHVVVIGSSTGGPTALIDIFVKMPARSLTAILVAQHMPDKFTRTFAERLDRKGHLRVTEAQDMDVISACTGTICPGRQCMEMEMIPGTTEFRVRISAPKRMSVDTIRVFAVSKLDWIKRQQTRVRTQERETKRGTRFFQNL